MSDGAELLAGVNESRAAIARRVGTSRAAVSRWVHGSRVPSEEHRQALWEVYGIPLEAWPAAATAALNEAVVERLRQRMPVLYRQLVREVDASRAPPPASHDDEAPGALPHHETDLYSAAFSPWG